MYETDVKAKLLYIMKYDSIYKAKQAPNTCNPSNRVTDLLFSQNRMAWMIEEPHCQPRQGLSTQIPRP